MKQLYLLGSILCLLCACAKDNIPTDNSEGEVRYKSIATINGAPFVLEAGKEGYAIGTSVEINPSNGFNVYSGQLYQANGGTNKGTLKLEVFDDTLRTSGNVDIAQLVNNLVFITNLPAPLQEHFAFSLNRYYGICQWDMNGIVSNSPSPMMSVVGGSGHANICVTITASNGEQNTLCNYINIDTAQRHCRMHGFRTWLSMGSGGIANDATFDLVDQGWTIDQIEFGDGTSQSNVNRSTIRHSYMQSGTYRVSIVAKNQDCEERFSKDIVVDYPTKPKVDYIWDSRVITNNGSVPGQQFRYRLTYTSPSGKVYKSALSSTLPSIVPRAFNIKQSMSAPGRNDVWMITADDMDITLYEEVTRQSVRFKSTDFRMALGTR